MREPLQDLLEAVITESDEALPEFRRWCEMHVDVIESIAFASDLPTSLADLSFEDALAFVRMQLHALESIRTTTGLDASRERRYEGLCAMEIDLIARISAWE